MPACLQGKAVPSSLRNMYKELKTDLGCDGELSWRQLGCNRVPQ
jgi:uracil DNA glycosylase